MHLNKNLSNNKQIKIPKPNEQQTNATKQNQNQEKTSQQMVKNK